MVRSTVQNIQNAPDETKGALKQKRSEYGLNV